MKKKKVSLKKRYYQTYFFYIVLPILIVLLFSLIAVTFRYGRQAKENISRMQETLATELTLDIEKESLKLSHLVHTNSNQILDYASLADTENIQERYESYVKLNESSNLVLEPSTNLVSLSFYMKDGRDIPLITQVDIENVRDSEWYLSAKEDKNHVYVGSYPIMEKDEAFLGSKRKSLLLIFALSPDITTDRNEKIENIVIYYTTDVSDKIEQYNNKFIKGKNQLGYTQIVDNSGDIIYSPDGEKHTEGGSIVCVKTPVQMNGTTWYIESYINYWKLVGDVWQIVLLAMIITVLILLLSAYFSRFLIRDIVKPIEDISAGLKLVEEGQLDVHVEARGETEVRNMIHQFNAMARRIKALIGEYEEKVQNSRVNPEEFLAAILSGEMTPQDVADKMKEFFTDRYVLFAIYMEPNHAWNEVRRCFERNPRFVSRCIAARKDEKTVIVKYRVTEEAYAASLIRMIQELQQETEKKLNISMNVCISEVGNGPEKFGQLMEEACKYLDYRHLFGKNAIIDLAENANLIHEVEQEASDEKYDRLAKALYIADEKNASQEREHICDTLRGGAGIKQGQIILLTTVLRIAAVFDENDMAFSDVLGEAVNYVEKIKRMDDLRSMKLWLTNYCAWIMDYSTEKLKISDSDVTVKAKRYIAEHYEEPELTLKDVADCVGLNENYFTNRFTKETGETFSNYLTTLRMQKAKELLKTTQFKVYEVAEMVGYRNVEHFNRVFKKNNGMTPAQYRKSDDE